MGKPSSPGTRPVHPVHALLLAFPVALFTSALVSDIAYLNTAEMQWSNFAAWLITGALLFASPVLLWAAILLWRRRDRGQSRRLVYFLLLLVMWTAGLVNAFRHSLDAWSSVGAPGVGLSVICTLAALGAGWLAFSRERIAP